MSSDTELKIDKKWGERSPMHDPYILANFKPRASDILITTAPKAGTTWMQQILHQLRSKGDDQFDYIDEVVPWLEIQRNGQHWSEIIDTFDKISAPRIFKTHCTYEQTPGVDVARIILTSRDPRDACISFYHHLMNMTDSACQRVNITKPESFEHFFESWMKFGAWFRNVNGWWPHKNDKNVLWLRFEDLKINLAQSIDQILLFLDWQLDEKSKLQVLEYCSFQWMKINADKFTHRNVDGERSFKEGSFIRKGGVGDYKVLMSQTQEQLILDRVQSDLSQDCIQFLDLR